jgi:tRNA (guanine37-N1)-methyltransferase
MKVPEVLLSGHFEKIRRWRKEQSLIATLRKRPDLLRGARLDDEARRMLAVLEKAERPDENGDPLPEARK